MFQAIASRAFSFLLYFTLFLLYQDIFLLFSHYIKVYYKNQLNAIITNPHRSTHQMPAYANRLHPYVTPETHSVY